MKMKTLMSLAVGAALALPFATMAQDRPSSSSASASAGASGGASSPPTQAGRDANSSMYKHLDRNNDGHISMEEMKSGQHERDFARLDKDRDTRLSFQEFSELNVGSASVGSSTGGEAGGSSSGASGGAATPAPALRY